MTQANCQLQLSHEERIAKAKAEISAKMAAFGIGKKLGGPSPSQSTASASASSTSASLPARPATSTGTTLNLAEMARQVAEAKRLAAASMANKAVQQNPYLVNHVVSAFQVPSSDTLS